MGKKIPRCEGYRRYGGAWTLGPVKWQQCTATATVMLTIKQDGKKQKLPACPKCWLDDLRKDAGRHDEPARRHVLKIVEEGCKILGEKFYL